ncbi:PTS lactose/cellobiose transporter subunit IIA [Oceanobacillus sojae]|nr:PTS lactose/cellobiose transporter subunit IIA [Oceanobacillus sojae]MCT1901923.1 PTS lactose/cellobiose transporter subunit IIA [Oceanobacillus sojae]
MSLTEETEVAIVLFGLILPSGKARSFKMETISITKSGNLNEARKHG